MNATSIQEVAMQAVEAFRQHGYTERSIAEKKRILFQIVDLHEQIGEHYYNDEVISKFVQESANRYTSGDINRIYYRFLTKTATYLTELHNTGSINFAQRLVPMLPDYYEHLLDGILTNKDWTEKTCRSVWPFAKTYFGWLHSKGYEDLSNVDVSILRQYLMDCASRMAASSLDTTKRMLKKLCAYLFEIGVGTGTYENLLSFSVLVGRKIKRAIPHSEIAAVLNVIDRNTVEGKRDYAMILLATMTGLREIDIVELKRDDIDWRIGEIKIVQSKTEVPLALPLTTDVGTAVQDYIINGRPKSVLDNVFLRTNAPIKKISNAILYGQFNGYRAKAGLPKCSFHGLRRTLGSNMIISGVPITTAAQVLGHLDIDSTKQYIPLDTEQLKECALDLTGIAPKTGKRGGTQ